MHRFHSHGKLLISGEYVVLDGATALALPTKYGQSLEVTHIPDPVISWKSLDHKGETWLEQEYDIAEVLSQKSSAAHDRGDLSERLLAILKAVAQMQPAKFDKGQGYSVITKTEFPANWGLGSSSTLLANIAKWCELNPYELLENTFGGSGYDIAVAMESAPITFAKAGNANQVLKVSFDPPFKEKLFFIHLNQKQNSRDSINHYLKRDASSVGDTIEKVSALSYRILCCTDLSEFNLLLEIHENIISQVTGLEKVKTRLFPDFSGAVKSLGGWGGDFVLATGDRKDMAYFEKLGYSTILPFSEMIL